MGSLSNDISLWFWNPDIWLPPNITWSTFKEPKVLNDTVIEPENYAKFSDLWYPIPMALVVMVIRWVVEKGIFKPVGIRMGLKDQRKQLPVANDVLEKEFRRSSKTTVKEVTQLALNTGMTILQVERWLRQRRVASQPSKLQKFCETGWRWVFYTTILVYGFNCLMYKPWLWNVRYCWYDYPFHTVDPDIWLYYMMELSFYWSLVISQFFDVKRKDFWEMFIHHNTTIALMMFSWSTHFTRVGTLVLIIHDCSDHLLELAKIFRYINYRKSCDAVFVIFTLVWVLTRCVAYPSIILYSTLHDAAGYIEMFPGYYIFNSLLVTLQILNVVWTFFIFRAIHKAFTKGDLDDNRSDSEETSEDENVRKEK